MATPELDVIKDIPGYKVILKAVLKSQIRQLVEQLATSTDEESVLLTASVSDGTLSHLGSDSGQGFLEGHEDIKSQFLGYCLKNHHRKTQEKEREKEAAKHAANMQQQFANRPDYPANRHVGPPSHMYPSPRQPLREGMRHEPYPTSRPFKSRNQRHVGPRTGSPSNLHRSSALNNSNPSQISTPQRESPLVTKKVIKVEPDAMDDVSSQVANGINSAGAPNGGDPTTASPNHHPSHSPAAPDQITSMKSEQVSSSRQDNTASEASRSEDDTSELTFGDTAPAEGLSLDSDLSNLLSPPGKEDMQSSDSVNIQSNTDDKPVDETVADLSSGIKVEAVSEAEVELEITGVELGRFGSGAQDEQGTSDYNMEGAVGGQGGVPGKGYDNKRADEMLLRRGRKQSGYILSNYGKFGNPKKAQTSSFLLDDQPTYYNNTDTSEMFGSSYDFESDISCGSATSGGLAVCDNQYWSDNFVNAQIPIPHQDLSLFTADDLLVRKSVRGKPTSAQYSFHVMVRDAAKIAQIWNTAPILSEITEEQKAKFFDAILSVAPQLSLRMKDVWRRLGDCLQNRRKYILDKQLGRR